MPHNREKADLCRRLLCQGDDKPFQAETSGFARPGDCRQQRDKGLSRGREYSFKMITGHLVTEKDCLPVPEVRETRGQTD